MVCERREHCEKGLLLEHSLPLGGYKAQRVYNDLWLKPCPGDWPFFWKGSTLLRSRIASPVGAEEVSPARKRWVGIRRTRQAPEGRHLREAFVTPAISYEPEGAMTEDPSEFMPLGVSPLRGWFNVAWALF